MAKFQRLECGGAPLEVASKITWRHPGNGWAAHTKTGDRDPAYEWIAVYRIGHREPIWIRGWRLE